MHDAFLLHRTGTTPGHAAWHSRGDCADVKAYRAGAYSDGALDDACIAMACQITWVPMQSIGLQWNMLHGSVPATWANLRADTVWLRPGNYQLCGTKPENASFELCKEVDNTCKLLRISCQQPI